MTTKVRVSSGVADLDYLLGGLFIGDNVVWHDDSGNLASAFCLSFLQMSLAKEKPVIYVCFDRSPKNLLDKLGRFAESTRLTILDAFTCGKGGSSPVFMKFYEGPQKGYACAIKRIEKPHQMDDVAETLYAVHGTLEGDVRLVFESITGMQEVWGGEEAMVRFYTHACPRLYELETIAYWIIEKLAHSQRLKAQINQIAQVAIDLSIRRGTTSLTILKAENRGTQEIDRPYRYWAKDGGISFETERHGTGQFNLGMRIKALRAKRGMSQSELARLVGVTPSTISQVEANTIYPSVPALLKMAEVLSINIGSLFQDALQSSGRFIFPSGEAVAASFRDLPKGTIEGKLLIPPDLEGKMEPYLVEIMPGQAVRAHFFLHRGEEMGYLLGGELQVVVKDTAYTVKAGDTIYLTSEMPTEWKNPGPGVATLLWIKAT
jgi:transcriptional regulator with XRE-family HTH domain